MGLAFTKFWERLVGRLDVRILMVGLDAAGKTTILYNLKLGKVVDTIPTVGFNVEMVEYKNISFTVWDMGGQNNLRYLYRHYLQGTGGLIYVVDSSDRERLGEAAEALASFVSQEELREVPLLVLANKQDLPGAVAPAEIAQTLGLPDMWQRQWFVQSACGISGEGLHEGLDWLSSMVSSRRRDAEGPR